MSSLLLVARSRIWGVEQGVYAVCAYMLYIHQRLVLDDRLLLFFLYVTNFSSPETRIIRCRLVVAVVVVVVVLGHRARRSSSKNLYFKCIHRSVDLKTVLYYVYMYNNNILYLYNNIIFLL